MADETGEKRRFRPLRRRDDPPPAPVRPIARRPADPRAAVKPQPKRRFNASPALSVFIDFDESERFDLFEINSTDFWVLDDELLENREASRAVMEDIDDIIARVEREVADPGACGELLRRRIFEWATQSAGDLEWATRVRARWCGLFYESREPGQRLRPALIDRLLRFRSVAVEGARTTGYRMQRLMDAGTQENESGRAPGAVFLRAAQALLDDLAEAPRGAGAVHPLVRLSELGDRVGRGEVTSALGAIFSSESQDVIIVLHPSRYPGADFVGIQAPPRKARGPWLTFSLVMAPSPSEPSGPPVPGARAAAAPQAPGVVAAPSGAPTVPVAVPAPRMFAPRVTFAAPVAIFAGGSLWDLPEVVPDQWRAELQSVASRGDRAEAPPLDGYRKSSAFIALRDLLIADADLRLLFHQTAWRGKPRGLPLLASLLRDGVFEPEFDTDASYLEAELEPFAPRGGVPRDGEAMWKLPCGWTVKRVVAGGTLRYTASAA